jgi:signal peptidase II
VTDIRKLDVTRQGAVAYALALSVIVVDQLSKAAMLGAFAKHCGGFVTHPVAGQGGPICRIEVSPLFDLNMVWNQGMSFGLLRGHGDVSRWALTLFALAVAGALIWWVRKADKPLFAWSAGLLIGGAIGNVIDRFRYGAVVDFLDFGALHFPWVFNVADSAITVGATLLLIEAFVPQLRSQLASDRDRVN